MNVPQVGDVWRVRLGVLEGERQIIATFGKSVAVCAPSDHRIDYYRWHQIEFLNLIRRANGKAPLVMP